MTNQVLLNGQWEIIITYGAGYEEHTNEQLICQATFFQSGEDIKGEAFDVSGVGMSPDKAMIKGKIKGAKLSFIKQYEHLHYKGEGDNVIVDRNNKGMKIYYDGHLENDEVLNGIWAYKRKLFGFITIGTQGSGTWQMRRM